MGTGTGKTHLLRATALTAALVLAAADAAGQRSCPAFVELPSGSSLHVARLINDTGSPDAALHALQKMLAQATQSGCPPNERPAACDETLAVARKAITALELCSGSAPDGSAARTHPKFAR